MDFCLDKKINKCWNNCGEWEKGEVMDLLLVLFFVFLTEQVTSALRKHFFFFNLSKDYLKSTEEFINQPHRTHTQSHWKLTETVKPHFTHLLKFPILRLHYLRVTSLPGTTFFCYCWLALKQKVGEAQSYFFISLSHPKIRKLEQMQLDLKKKLIFTFF